MKKYRLVVSDEIRLKLERMKEILAGTPRGEYISGLNDGCDGVCRFTCSYFCRPQCEAQCISGCGSGCADSCMGSGITTAIEIALCPELRIFYN